MKPTVMGLFVHIENAAPTIMPLEALTVKHKDIHLLSATPYPHGTLFHEEEPPIWAWAMIGGFVGLTAGLFLAGFTQWLINLNVGGKDPVSYPVVALICYETTNLGIILGSLLAMLWYGDLPDWTEKAYDPEISDGLVGVLVQCEDEGQAKKVEDIFNEHGATKIKKGAGDF